MQAAINTEYGGPHVLQLDDVPRPSVGAQEILVEVGAADVTQGDRRLRAADFPGLSAIFGRLMFGLFSPRQQVGGTSFAGRVVEVGADVHRFAVGDDVFGGVLHGAYAEFLVVSEDDSVALMPKNTSYVEAAALPYGAVTALVFLRDIANVQPGERVLIVGASGGVGRMAVQVARSLGAQVTGVVSRYQDLTTSLGATEIIDYKAEDFTESGKTWDVIFDTTQGAHFAAFSGVLSLAGRYLSLYMTLRILFEMAMTKLRGGPRALVGVAMGSAELTDDVRTLVEQGAIRPVVSNVYPLSEIASAHGCLEQGPPGSIVVEMAALAS